MSGNTTQIESGQGAGRTMLNKVPEITLYFWVIKILCTTVGETFADFLNVRLGLGLTNTTWAMGLLLAVVLLFEFKSDRYRPGRYWLAVVLLSIVGTLITDNLTDNMGVSLVLSTLVFGGLLAATFAIWYAKEKTLSVSYIDTLPREAYYWLAILFTFALGTAGGDLVAEQWNVGYLLSALGFTALIGAAAVAHMRFGLNAIFSFWFAYVLTRPLGASIGDLLSQPRDQGGLGVGTVVTSVLFLATILALVIYLKITKKDVTEPESGMS